MKKSNKKRNIIYSTNPDFEFEYNDEQEEEIIPNQRQNLKIFKDRKNRGGKTVTIISGFIGSSDDLKSLGRELKTLCGSGGSVKNGEILLQGDFIKKVSEFLNKNNYKYKISGI